MSGPLSLVEDAVRRARRAGADQVEAYFEDRLVTTIEVREQQLEVLTSAATRGLGLRVIVDGATSYVYTSDPSPRDLSELARRAVSLAREAAPDPDRGLPDVALPPLDQDLAIYDARLAELGPEPKIELLRKVERACRSADPRVHSTELARYSDSLGTVALANSHGLAAAYQQSSASAIIACVARDGGSALSGYGYTAGRGFADLDPEAAGQQAARRAALPLGGRPVQTQHATVVLDAQVAAGLLSQVALALSAEAVQKGRSMYAGRLGERVAAATVTLVDQGDLPGALGSTPFDGEGVPSGRTVLIEDGILRSLLHSSFTARRAEVAPTGNAVRSSYRGGPEVGATNFSLVTTAVPRSELLAGVERGLLVYTTRNVGGINPVNSDYSVGAAGVWIEQGREQGPVAGVTIAASMHDMLRGLAAMGDDFRWTPSGGNIGCGSLRVEGMTIAGA